MEQIVLLIYSSVSKNKKLYLLHKNVVYLYFIQVPCLHLQEIPFFFLVILDIFFSFTQSGSRTLWIHKFFHKFNMAAITGDT